MRTPSKNTSRKAKRRDLGTWLVLGLVLRPDSAFRMNIEQASIAAAKILLFFAVRVAITKVQDLAKNGAAEAQPRAEVSEDTRIQPD